MVKTMVKTRHWDPRAHIVPVGVKPVEIGEGKGLGHAENCWKSRWKTIVWLYTMMIYYGYILGLYTMVIYCWKILEDAEEKHIATSMFNIHLASLNHLSNPFQLWSYTLKLS
jgi:hypothetical protein